MCVNIFNKRNRAIASLQRVTKALALRVWNERRFNVLVFLYTYLYEKNTSAYSVDTILGPVHNVEKRVVSTLIPLMKQQTLLNGFTMR
jgi:hypothetical protein